MPPPWPAPTPPPSRPRAGLPSLPPSEAQTRSSWSGCFSGPNRPASSPSNPSLRCPRQHTPQASRNSLANLLWESSVVGEPRWAERKVSSLTAFNLGLQTHQPTHGAQRGLWKTAQRRKACPSVRGLGSETRDSFLPLSLPSAPAPAPVHPSFQHIWITSYSPREGHCTLHSQPKTALGETLEPFGQASPAPSPTTRRPRQRPCPPGTPNGSAPTWKSHLEPDPARPQTARHIKATAHS